MALNFRFDIPAPQIGQEAAYSVVLYQGDDGQSWDLAETLSELVSNLTIDGDGKYSWTVNNADAARWSLVKTVDINSVQSPNGIIFSPQLLPTTNYGAARIEDGTTVYRVGNKIDLMLKLDADDAVLAGDTLTVQIRDIFDNYIGQVIAEKVGLDLYVAEFTIPVNLGDVYNSGAEDESSYNPSLYYLKDIWVFQDATSVEYDFTVSRTGLQQPVADNMLYSISVNGLNGSNSNQLLRFTSTIDTFYASLDDLYAFMPGLEGSVDPMTLVRQIVRRSEYVDYHMKPNVIYDQLAYNNAVRCFVSKTAAIDMIKEDAGLTSESKTLDAMTIQRAYGNGDRLKALEDEAMQCALIVYAGGLDTPFKSKVFVAGINDPARPVLGRAGFDNRIGETYFNITAKQITVDQPDGSVIEYRGYRTVAPTGYYDLTGYTGQ